MIDGVTDNPCSAVPADVDRDGDLDVVVVSQVSPAPKMSWWENDGTDGGWTQTTIGGGVPLSAMVADLDLDGDPDLLTGAGGGVSPGAIEESLNQAPGDGSSWSVASGVGSFDGGELFPLALASADFDLDGDPDAAGAAAGAADVYWWANDGSSGWPRSPITSTASDVVWLFAGDADGTRGPDLIAVDGGAGEIAVWENLAVQAELTATDVSPTEAGDGLLLASSSCPPPPWDARAITWASWPSWRCSSRRPMATRRPVGRRPR